MNIYKFISLNLNTISTQTHIIVNLFILQLSYTLNCLQKQGCFENARRYVISIIVQMIVQSQSRVKLEQSANDHTALTFQCQNQLSPPDYRFQHGAINAKLNSSKYSKQLNKSVYQASDAQSFRPKRRKINPDKPKQKQLCQAILCLKKKLPMRSLEQVIIRLYQTFEAKLKMHNYAKEYVFAPERRIKQEAKNRQQTKVEGNQIEEQNQLNGFGVESTVQHDQNGQAETEIKSSRNNEDSSVVSNEANYQTYFQNSNRNQLSKLENVQGQSLMGQPLQKEESEQTSTPLIIQLPDAPPNYIYKPRDVEITVTYRQKDTHPVNFQSPEQEAKYIERRFVVKAFLERGYGFNQLRDQILAEGYSFEITPSQYKSLAGGVAILALKKLESFLMYECGKMIVQFDRSQMRELCSYVLGCRTAMDSEQAITICKYLKAGVGMGDVTIGESESVRVYLSILDFIHKKRVTMEALQKIGEQEYFKKMEATLQSIKNKKLQKEAKLAETKLLRSNKIHRKKAKRQTKTPESHQNTKNEKQEGGQIKNEDQKNNETTKSQYAPINLQEALQLWKDSMDLQLIDIYLQKKSVLVSFRIMKGKHPQLQKWPPSLYHKKFSKIVKKAVRKVQVDSQLCENPTMPILNRLQKDELRKIVFSKDGENVRTSLFEYYKQTVPNENQLANVANMTNMFVFTNIKSKSNKSSNQIKKVTVQKVTVPKKRGRPFKNMKKQYQDIDYQTIKAIKIDNNAMNINQEDSFKINRGRPLKNRKIKSQQSIQYNIGLPELINPSEDNNEKSGIFFSDQSNQPCPQDDLADIDVSLLTFQNLEEWQ